MFGPDPFRGGPPEDGDLGDAVDRALLLLSAVLTTVFFHWWFGS
jgi:hypothetical protein